MYLNISHIYLENFQSIRGPIRIDFSPITLLYGPNSSGKSAIHDAINIGVKLCTGEDFDEIEGSIAKFMHMHDFSQKMIIGIGSTLAFPHYYEPPAVRTFMLENFFPALAHLFYAGDYSIRKCNWDIRFTLGFFQPKVESLKEITHYSCVEKIEIFESNQLVVELNIDEATLAINLLHPLVDVVNLAISEDGLSLQDLCFEVIEESQLIVRDAIIFIHGFKFDDEKSWVPNELKFLDFLMPPAP